MTEQGTTDYPVVAARDLLDKLRRFNTSYLLEELNGALRYLGKTSAPPYLVERSVKRGARVENQKVYFTPWALAFLAKYSIIESNNLRAKRISAEELFELVGLFSLLEDPFRGDPTQMGAYSFLIRTAWEQFSLQEPLKTLIPRYYSMFALIPRDEPSQFNISEAWERISSMSVEDFMVLGFGAWAMASEHSSFRRDFMERTTVEQVARRANRENVQAFFALVTANYEKFRKESARFKLSDARYAKTEFNMLRKFPIIEARPYELIAPVPQLVLERVTRGIFYDLLDAYSEERGNPFLAEFGRVFEHYSERLLKRAYGDDKVIREPVYGKEHLRGPDLIVMEGDTAVLIECTISGTRLETRSIAEEQDIVEDLTKVYADRVKRFPGKIDDLKSGKAGVDISGITRFVPVVVTHEPLFLEPIVRSLLYESLGKETVEASQVLFIDIGDLEAVTGWSDTHGLVRVLDDWQAAYKDEPQSLSAFLPRMAGEQELSWENPLLAEVSDNFFNREVASDG